MTPEIMELAVKAILGVLGLLGIWLVGWIKDALKARVEAEQAAELDRLIYDFVACAEQTLKEKDPTGKIRKQYVTENLMALGFAISQEVNARIEAAVYGINIEARQDAE